MREEEEERLAEERRVAEVERQKKAEEERIAIVLEKEKYLEYYENRMKEENAAVAKREEDIRWAQMTEQNHKSYSTEGPKLSTFISVFEESQYEGP